MSVVHSLSTASGKRAKRSPNIPDGLRPITKNYCVKNQGTCGNETRARESRDELVVKGSPITHDRFDFQNRDLGQVHLVGAGEQRRRNVDAGRLSSLEVDAQFEFGGSLYW
jgi:hypothetical protein